MPCRICDGAWPRKDHLIGVCGLTTAYLFEDQFFPGWTVLALNRHVRELYELTQAERSGLMEEVASVARALAEEYRPVKVNYGLLGNQVPHIHWHVIPRLAGDPAPFDAVWSVPHEARPLTEGELAATLARLRARMWG